MLVTGQTIRDRHLAWVLGFDSDEFRVLQVISGGMGAVAKVQSATGDIFALKFLDLEEDGSDILNRFRQEVQIWVSAASCDAVVEVRGTVRINEIPAVCAEWMPGGDLTRLMGSLEPAIFYSAMDRIIAGLDWVHQEHKIVHRDIKPSNILLDSAGNPFISDWGIGRVSIQFDKNAQEKEAGSNKKLTIHSSTLTRTGRVLGTIPYCSPEQILNSRCADFRSDMYSLACVMYQWEVGTPPFSGSRWEEVARKHLESPPPKIAGVLRRSRFGAEAVISRCLEKNPDDRFSSYGELREVLRHQALRRNVNFTRAEVAGRRSMPLVGHNQLSHLKPSIVGTEGYALIEAEAAEGFRREARTLMTVGEWQKAYDIYSRLWLPGFYPEGCANFSPNIEAAVNMGACLAELGRPKDAIQILETVPESQRVHAEFFLNMGYALLRLAKFAEAEEVTIRGLKTSAEDGDLLGNLTTSLIMQGKYLEALPHASARLTKERNVHSLEEAGSVLKSIGAKLRFSDLPKAKEGLIAAAEFLREALVLNPFFHTARWTLAQTLFEMDLFSEALDVAAKLPHGPVWGRLRITMIAECLNRTSAAKECLEFCSKWKPQVPDAVDLQRVEAETVADFYCIGKQDSEGRKIVVPQCLDFFNTIVRDANRRTLSDFIYLSRLAEWLDQPDVAALALDDARSIYGDQWEVFFAYAWLHGRADKWETAHANSKRACELAPWHPPVWRQRYWIEENLGLSASASSKTKADEISKKVEEMRKSALDALRSSGAIE